MTESVDELKREIATMKGVLMEREKRTQKLEHAMQGINYVELSQQVKEVTAILQGGDGKNGLKRSVDRLLMLIDGDDRYQVIGIVKQICDLREEVQKLVDQRNQIKWAVYGMLAVTGLGNAEGIISLLRNILMP